MKREPEYFSEREMVVARRVVITILLWGTSIVGTHPYFEKHNHGEVGMVRTCTASEMSEFLSKEQPDDSDGEIIVHATVTDLRDGPNLWDMHKPSNAKVKIDRVIKGRPELSVSDPFISSAFAPCPKPFEVGQSGYMIGVPNGQYAPHWKSLEEIRINQKAERNRSAAKAL